MQRIQFELNCDTLAAYADDSSRDQLVIIIPAGARITLLDKSLSSPSVRVKWNGREVAIFSEVLRSGASEPGRFIETESSLAEEQEEFEDDLSASEKIQLIEHVLLLSRQCWSRTLKSCHGELQAMRERLVQESGSAKVIKAGADADRIHSDENGEAGKSAALNRLTVGAFSHP